MITSVDAGVLGIAYEERGVPRGAPVVRSHGFPFDAMTRARKPVIAGPAISLDGNSESVAADIGGRLAERFAGGDKKAALAEYETAVKLSPDRSTNYAVLAEAYLHFDRKDDAIRVLKAVADIKNPADPAEYPSDLADAQRLLAKLNAK